MTAPSAGTRAEQQRDAEELHADEERAECRRNGSGLLPLFAVFCVSFCGPFFCVLLFCDLLLLTNASRAGSRANIAGSSNSRTQISQISQISQIGAVRREGSSPGSRHQYNLRNQRNQRHLRSPFDRARRPAPRSGMAA